MLELILGRAGTGKTALIMEELRDAVLSRRGNMILLVPEQYSHEAERELASICGDSMSLYAEVLSFTGLARRVESELGGGAALRLNKSGRLLCMALAVREAAPLLRVYGKAARRPELQKKLLAAMDELQSVCIAPEDLSGIGAAGALNDKLHDLSVIFSAWEAVVLRCHADPEDRLSRLADRISDSSICRGGHIYIDGFTDFTGLELKVIRSLICGGADVTLCLTCDGLAETSEIFESSRRTALLLKRCAEELGTVCNLRLVTPHRASGALAYTEEHLFEYVRSPFDGDTSPVSVFTADSPAAECALAASTALSFVRERGCRWRDIAVAVRGFEEYRPILEDAFAVYGVPMFSARRSDMLQKPIPALIASAFETVSGGWEYDPLFCYLKTGLTGLSDDDRDILENYILRWDIKGSAWTCDTDWTLHPLGWGEAETEASAAMLERINLIRRTVSAPLLALQRRGREAVTAGEQAQALALFLDDIELPAHLSERASALLAHGMASEAAEYSQLWNIVTDTLEQCSSILGSAPMSQEEFAGLWSSAISLCDVGIIPVSLDRVSAGDMDRMRRRSIKHLIVLGSSDERLPMISGDTGIFSYEEREQLSELGLDLGCTGENELYREMNLIYNCLTLPSETLTVSRPVFGFDGGQCRPSFVSERLCAMFGKPEQPFDRALADLSAPWTALLLAAQAMHGRKDDVSSSALEYFSSKNDPLLISLSDINVPEQSQLAPDSVQALYGDIPRLSASRVEAFASCPFSYFLQYGLQLKPREKAGFDAPAFGSFMHFVLENTAHEISRTCGFERADSALIEKLTDKYTGQYIRSELHDFDGKSERFIYLFRRQAGTVRRITADMVRELSRSEFRPLDFELDFSGGSGMAPIFIGDRTPIRLTGIADRVDGWEHDGKLYIRIIDYKTGKKAFSLSDICHGSGMQMPLYLAALTERGEARYGKQIVPAGVLYVPARDVTVRSGRDLGDDEIDSIRARQLRRSGLILNDGAVISAMESDSEFRYLPVRSGKSGISGDALATEGQLNTLSGFVKDTVSSLAERLTGGSVEISPLFKSEQENACLYCKFSQACRSEESRSKRRWVKKLSAEDAWSTMEGGGNDE